MENTYNMKEAWTLEVILAINLNLRVPCNNTNTAFNLFCIKVRGHFGLYTLNELK